MVIFDRKNLNQELTIGEVPGTMYGLNPGSGWIDQELFRDWFERHFLQYALAARSLLLLLDGHSTHYQPEVVQLAASSGVIMFALPPTQPMLHSPWMSRLFMLSKHTGIGSATSTWLKIPERW